MPFETIKAALDVLEKFYSIAITNQYNLKNIDHSRAMYDFKEKKKKYCLDSITKNIAILKRTGWKLSSLDNFDSKNEVKVNELLGWIKELDSNYLDPSKSLDYISKIKLTLSQITFEKILPKLSPKQYPIQTPNLPADILPDLLADLDELKKCFGAECFRSCVILCGRILEGALHKKYFDATGFDILEKNPGIGLGNLVAKLRDKNVALDPGITQQIHLVNQVRIFSVHKKKEVFVPSQDQSYAVILYTLSILSKLFNK